jgi:hypothetical protein
MQHFISSYGYLARTAGRYGGEAATRRWSRFPGGRSGIERPVRFERLADPVSGPVSVGWSEQRRTN